MRKGVAFHHAGIPKYIQSEIIDYFNDGCIDTIVCTPTITEGVNTSAKNVIFFDTKKANDDLSGFDVKNIMGRSGRFGKHFIGRTIFLENYKKEEELEKVSFPFFDSYNLSDEDNIQIEEKDLNPVSKSKREKILRTLKKLNISIDVIKSNRYVKFDNQILLLSYFRRYPQTEGKIHFSEGLPNKSQVDLVVELIYDLLFSDNDKKKGWTHANLSRLVKHKIYLNPTIKDMIEQYDAKSIDTKIRNVFEIKYRYFDFLLPKYLSAFENLFNYSFDNKISFKYMISTLQYGSDKKQDVLLGDAGVPISIVQKVSGFLDGHVNASQIRQTLSTDPKVLDALTDIEKRILKKRV